MNPQNQLVNLNRACHNFKGIVFSSQTALKSLEKFELTPAEFLRPFFQLSTRIKLTIPSKERYIDDFAINLLDREEFQASNKETLDSHTREILRDNAPGTEAVQMTSKFYHRGSVDLMIDAHKMTYFHACAGPVGDFSSHQYGLNFLDQPLLLIYVVNGHEPEIVREIQRIKMDNDKWLKAMFINNPTDLDAVKKFILVLNDAQGKVHFSQEDKLRKDFAHHTCKIMTYNYGNIV